MFPRTVQHKNRICGMTAVEFKFVEIVILNNKKQRKTKKINK